MRAADRLRLGLCCLFVQEPVRFRTTTATALRRLGRKEQLRKLSDLCLHNANNLQAALETCQRLGIASFRISSPLFPVYTHPQVGYALDDLPDAGAIRATFAECARFGAAQGIRRSLHPDQFVLLNSPRPDVVAASLAELDYQAVLAELAGAEVINLHVGGAYGDKLEAMRRFESTYRRLPEAVRSRLSLENDDVRYSPADTLALSDTLGVPVVYDAHHHRCLPDGLDAAAATRRCAATWQRLGREPYFHLSSPRDGWTGRNPKAHADYIDPSDVPEVWRRLRYRATVDVEAKAKELAVLALRQYLDGATP